MADTSASNIKKENTLSHFELYAILTRGMLGAVLFGVYRAVVERAGRDSWISFILAGLLVQLASLIIIALNRRFPGHTFVEYAQLIVGKWPGRFLGLLLTAYFLFTASVSLRLLGEMVVTWILPETPLLIILGLSLLVVLYMVYNGILVLGRYCTAVMVAIIPLIILMFMPASRWMINNILPIGQSGVMGILSGMIPGLYAYQSYEVLLLIYPFVKEKNRITRTASIAIIYTTFVYVMIMVFMIFFFGPKEIRFVLYPPLIYLEAVEIPLIERLDLFAFFAALFSISANIGILYCMVTLGIARLFSIKKQKNIAFFIYPLLLIMAWIPENVAVIADFYTLISVSNVIVGMGIPLLLLILSLLLKKKGRSRIEQM